MNPKVAAKPVGSLVLFADAYPDGSGGFLLKLRPPRSLVFQPRGKRFVQEISTVDACKVLSVERATIHHLINRDPNGKRIIRWRFTSSQKGKRMFDVASLLDFVEFTKTLED